MSAAPNLILARLEAGRASLNQPRRGAYLRLIKQLADKNAEVALRVCERSRWRLPENGYRAATRYIKSASIRQGRPITIPTTEVRRGDSLISRGAEGNMTVLRVSTTNNFVRKVVIEWIGENGERGVFRMPLTRTATLIRPPREAVLPARLDTPIPSLPTRYEFGRGRVMAWGEMEAYAARHKKPEQNSGTVEKTGEQS